MKITEIANADELREFMTTPTKGLVEMLRRLEGDVLVLGGAGKVGPELVETMTRANREAGAKRTFYVADLFPEGSPVTPEQVGQLGTEVMRGDLTDRAFLQSLPDAPHVIFMVGLKFGSSKDWRAAFHINAILPYLAGERFTRSNIVAFTSANPYPHTPIEQGGSREADELGPQGVYGWGIVARESALATTQLKNPEQEVAFYRLAYAQHLGYGVLVDLARMVMHGETISLAMPAVNLISQRDAIDAAIRLLQHCDSPAFVLNVAGPAVRVREICEKLGSYIGKDPIFADDEGDTALLANDELCRRLFGEYRDGVDDVIEAAAKWVMAGGEYWDKPTLFGRVKHEY